MLELEQHGLVWVHAPAVLRHPLPGGDWAVLHHDRDATARGMESQHAGDGEAWAHLCTAWDRIGHELVNAMLTPFPPVRAGARVLARLRSTGGLEFVRMMLTPAMNVGHGRFAGTARRILVAGNAGHADIPLNAPGSGLMGILRSMLAQGVGFPVPRGGAGELTAALARRLTAAGSVTRCSHQVTAVTVRDRRATGVSTGDGQRFDARHAVIADVAAPNLYGGLVSADDLPARTVTTSDPSRSPLGTESMWAYEHVPQHAVRDAGGGSITGNWDRDDGERLADRMQARIEVLAHGFGSRILSRRVLGPRELESRDANLIGGAINQGTSQLHRQLVLRPVPGWGRAESPVRNLLLGSAAP